MPVDSELPHWGRTARRTFREVFSPLLGLIMLLTALRGMGWSVTHIVPVFVLLPVSTVIVAGFVVSGVVWLVAEGRTGFHEPRGGTSR